MADHEGSSASLLSVSSAASSVHLPLDILDSSLNGTAHGRRQSLKPREKQTASQAFLKTLRPSPYANAISSKSMSKPLFPGQRPKSSQSPGAAQPPRARSLSASSHSAKAAVASHKTREDLLDEVTELKKASRTYQHERSLLVGRVRHLEEELTKKDKRIASFLESGYVEQQHAIRTRGPASAKAENMTMLMVLKRKVHALETTLRQKDNELSQLKMDLKTTSLEELQIKVDTYHEEVMHLRQVLTEQAEERRERREARQSAEQIKALSDSLKRLAERNEELRQENMRLSEEAKAAEAAQLASTSASRLSSVLSSADPSRTSSSANRKLLKNVKDRFADSTRQEMVEHVTKIEARNADLNHALQQVNQEHLAALNEVKILKQRDQEADDRTEHIKQLEERCEKLRSVLGRLKEDRTHYHTLADERKELAKKQAKEISSLGKREKTLTNNLKELEEQEAKEKLAREHARERERRKAKAATFGTVKDAHSHEAATLLQRQWRKRLSKKRQQKFEDKRSGAIAELQSALRGHLSRSTFLASHQQESSSEEDDEEEEEIEEKEEDV